MRGFFGYRVMRLCGYAVMRLCGYAVMREYENDSSSRGGPLGQRGDLPYLSTEFTSV